MSWQDDLTALDAERAAGRVDGPEYRRRKDEILADASGPTRNAPLRSRNSGADSEGPTQSMLPPPWERATAVGPRQETTDEPAAADLTAGDSTAGHSPATQRPTPAPLWPAPRADAPVSDAPSHQQNAPRTEEPYFPPVPPPVQPQPPVQQQPPAGQQPQFPPVAAHQQPPVPPTRQLFPHGGHPQQTPGFEHVGARKPRQRKGLLFACIGILVLALVAIGIFVVPWRSLTATPQLPPGATSAPPPQNPTGPASVPADVPASLPELPGTALPAPLRQPVNALEKDGYYGKPIVVAVNKAGTNTMVLRESVDGGDLIYLNAVLPMTSARGCQSTAAAINNHQRGLGFHDDDQANYAANTVTLSATTKAGTYFRSAYCSGRMTVLIGAATANKKKAAALRAGFRTASTGIVGRLPAN